MENQSDSNRRFPQISRQTDTLSYRLWIAVRHVLETDDAHVVSTSQGGVHEIAEDVELRVEMLWDLLLSDFFNDFFFYEKNLKQELMLAFFLFCLFIC